MWRNAASNLVTFLFLASLAALAAFSIGQHMYQRDGPLEKAIFFEVPKGSSLSAVAEELARSGVIPSEAIFRLGAKYWHDGEGSEIRKL